MFIDSHNMKEKNKLNKMVFLLKPRIHMLFKHAWNLEKSMWVRGTKNKMKKKILYVKVCRLNFIKIPERY